MMRAVRPPVGRKACPASVVQTGGRGRSPRMGGDGFRTPALEHHADVVEGEQVHGRLLRGGRSLSRAGTPPKKKMDTKYPQQKLRGDGTGASNDAESSGTATRRYLGSGGELRRRPCDKQQPSQLQSDDATPSRSGSFTHTHTQNTRLAGRLPRSPWRPSEEACVVSERPGRLLFFLPPRFLRTAPSPRNLPPRGGSCSSNGGCGERTGSGPQQAAMEASRVASSRRGPAVGADNGSTVHGRGATFS